ncbi:MAG TPA: methylenetetrahydrofolate reductase C-terminal domain-containing protein [Anaerolineaceae bacterium]|nr:methylenetetrahydrofolate reductase C-terminal domain-containing protein [Anaerolineaceae bacterium]
MPILTPGRRWQPIYYPFRREKFINRFLNSLEILYKGPLWGCRQCGNCLLQETSFICPMECPKGLRNGPCGGSTAAHCYVDETRPCIWYKIYERSFSTGREEHLMEVLPPLDWEQVGGEQLGNLAGQVRKTGARKVISGLLSSDRQKRNETWEGIFQPVRQPDWWQGDREYHAPGYDEPVSALERRLRSGEFVVTAEVQPPQTVATNRLGSNIDLVKPYVAAINFTDGASATPRMASWACSIIASQRGAEPVLQIAARDITRTSLQAQVLGANALGIRNILCLTGDSNRLSPKPRGRMDILDLDSIQMLWILRRMRDEGKYLDGREIKFPPKFFLGAAASPFASRPEFQAIREHKKVNAGAQFFQTNLVFDPALLETWLNELAKRNVLDKVFILAGISPLKSLKMAIHLDKEVPGVFIPAAIMKRMEKADIAGNPTEEGVQIALELIEAIKGKQGINGIHIMSVGWEEIVPRLVSEAGLMAK